LQQPFSGTSKFSSTPETSERCLDYTAGRDIKRKNYVNSYLIKDLCKAVLPLNDLQLKKNLNITILCLYNTTSFITSEQG